MSDKYIIRNCPCRMELHEDDCFGHTGYYNCCACTDCVVKKVVDKCKDKIRIYEYYDKDYALGQVECAKSILQLFNIQEAE